MLRVVQKNMQHHLQSWMKKLNFDIFKFFYKVTDWGMLLHEGFLLFWMHVRFWLENHHTSIKQPWENKQKRRKEKRRQPSKTPSFFFFLSSSFVFITHHHLPKIKNKTTHGRFGVLPAPSSRLKFYKKKREKIMSPITLHGDVDPSPWNANRILQQDIVYPSLLSTWMTLRIIQ